MILFYLSNEQTAFEPFEKHQKSVAKKINNKLWTKQTKSAIILL